VDVAGVAPRACGRKRPGPRADDGSAVCWTCARSVEREAWKDAESASRRCEIARDAAERRAKKAESEASGMSSSCVYVGEGGGLL
jgi:hypothetical protein